MQMCKSMVMENTACENKDCSDPTNSRYYCVVVQYVAKFNAEKLRKAPLLVAVHIVKTLASAWTPTVPLLLAT